MRIHYLQHVQFENLGNIENWIIKKGYKLSKTSLYNNEKLPDIKSFDLLIVMGGPMNVYEENEYPWLKLEKEFIKQSIEEDKAVLGICLGAQLIANVLGSKIYKNEYKEIGWFPICLTDKALESPLFKNLNETFDVFHWHGDTFELPENSVRIAASEACINQGFIYNERVIGLQFHLESSMESIENLIKHCNNEIVSSKYIHLPKDMKDISKLKDLNKTLTVFLENLKELLTDKVH